MSTAVIIQARMSSVRLPGKVMQLLAGIPVLEHTIDRVQQCRTADVVAVATSRDATDDPVAQLCGALGVMVHRGSLDDVAERMLQTAEAVGVNTVARVSADSPFIDPAIIDRGITLFHEGGADVVTNVKPRTFPVGQSVEVFAVQALADALAANPPMEEREHVTAILYSNPATYRVRNFEHQPSLAHLRFVIDTPEDFDRMQRLAVALPQVPTDLSVEALAEIAVQMR